MNLGSLGSVVLHLLKSAVSDAKSGNTLECVTAREFINEVQKFYSESGDAEKIKNAMISYGRERALLDYCEEMERHSMKEEHLFKKTLAYKLSTLAALLGGIGGT